MELFGRVDRLMCGATVVADSSPVNNVDISRLTNEEILTRAEGLAADERASMCDLIETLAVIDERKLYREREYTSLFEYCVFMLRQSDSTAYRHIRAARAVRLFPPVGPLLRSGRLTLESLVVIHPYLEDADAASLVAAAAGKRVSEVERMVASRRVEAPRRDVVRYVPPTAVPIELPPAPADETLFSGASVASPTAATTTAAPTVAPPRPPAAPGVRIAFTADSAFFKLLKEAQAAMRHKYPNGRLDGVFRDALEALLRKKRPWAYPKRAAGGRRGGLLGA